MSKFTKFLPAIAIIIAAIVVVTVAVAVTTGDNTPTTVTPGGDSGVSVCAHTGGKRTCTEPAVCTLCGEKYGEARGHVSSIIPAVPATCTESGLTQGEECLYCGTVLKAQQTVQATGHNMISVSAEAAGCTTDGHTAHSACTNCDYTEGKTIIPAAHSFIDVAALDATCTDDGYTAHKYCTVCEETEGKEILPAGHSFSDPDANGTRVCSACGFIEASTNQGLQAALEAGEKDIEIVGVEFDENALGKGKYYKDVTVTFTDCVFTGDNDYNYIQNATYQNCVFDCPATAIHFDQLFGELVFDNCTFKRGAVKIGTDKDGNASVLFTDCTFEDTTNTSIWSDKGLRVYSEATFENCEFNNRVVLAGGTGLPLHFDSCTMNGGLDVYYTNNSDGIIRGGNLPYVTINGVHVHVYTPTVTDPTCYEDGYTTYTCACGDEYVDDEVTTNGHNYGSPESNGNRTCSECGATEASSTEGVQDAIADVEAGDTVVLPEGNYTLPTLSDKTGVTVEGAADGSTVIGGDNTSTGFGSNFGADNTYKNLTFSGSSNGVRWSYAKGGTNTFDNCTFAGDSTYGFHMDQSNGATLIFNNCTFIGFNAFASDIVKVTFNNCTFLHNGSYGHTNIWSVGEFNNCNWGDKASVGIRGSGKLYFDGVEESYHHEFIGSAESLIDFQKSVNEGGDSWSGQKVLLVADIDLENVAWTPIGQTGATEFRGTFDGQGHTISNLYVDNTAYTDQHTSSGLFGWAEANVTIKNVNVDGATIKGNHNVAVIVGYTYSGVITNCHVSNATVVCTHANDDACGDKAGVIAGYAGDESRFTNCSAKDSTVTAGRDAGQVIGAGYNVSVSGCTAENVTVTAGGDCPDEKNINNDVIGRKLG